MTDWLKNKTKLQSSSQMGEGWTSEGKPSSMGFRMHMTSQDFGGMVTLGLLSS
jgi:hypothetical protein